MRFPIRPILLFALVWALPCVPTTGGQLEDSVVLRTGTLGGAEEDAGLPAGLVSSTDDLRSGGPAVLRFASAVTPELRRTMESMGIRLDLSVAPRAFVTWLPAGRLESVSEVPGLVWVAPLHPGLKIAPEIFRVHSDDPRTRMSVRVQLFPQFDVDGIAHRLKEMGLEIEHVSQGRSGTGESSFRPATVIAMGSPEAVVAVREPIARWKEVFWIEERRAGRWTNDAGAWVGQSGVDGNQSTPAYDNGLHGEGQILAVLDSGIDVDMCFFRDDVGGPPPVNVGLGLGSPDTQQRKVIIVDFLDSGDDPADPTDWDDVGHGTHVAGSAVADDPTTPGRRDAGDGMAPSAKLIVQDVGAQPDSDELYAIFEQAYLQGARIHSNSFGDTMSPPFNLYSADSAKADAFVWDHPDSLVLFAAGNMGPSSGTVTSPSTAKNVVSVGATRRGSSADKLWHSTSYGPTADGRYKPDITAPGTSVISAESDGDVGTNNCGTTSQTGTSMSCPTAAGFAALVREYFEKGYYPAGEVSPSDSLVPSGALLKATMIASARPMENVQDSPPSDAQGWGRLLLDDALYFAEDNRRLRVVDAAGRFVSPTDPGDSHEVEVLDSGETLRVVLAWTDYPSTPIAALNLVNDLDLEVESPTGTVYLGNNFAGGLSQPGGTADALNNVESVHVGSPGTGLWTVRVRPQAIPQPAQGYALAITGRVPVGALLERTTLGYDDSPGGDADGIVEPGEWVDLPLSLLNRGDQPATGISVTLESLTTEIAVPRSVVGLSDLAPGQQAGSVAPHLRIRPSVGFPCGQEVTLRFTYLADGYQKTQDTNLVVGGGTPDCAIYNPSPNAVDDLSLGRTGTDVMLAWKRPVVDPLHGEVERYRVFRSETASSGFQQLAEVTDGAPEVTWTDIDAADAGPLLFYEVIAGNASGDADPLP